jgi:hypothetical protein
MEDNPQKQDVTFMWKWRIDCFMPLTSVKCVWGFFVFYLQASFPFHFPCLLKHQNTVTQAHRHTSTQTSTYTHANVHTHACTYMCTCTGRAVQIWYIIQYLFCPDKTNYCIKPWIQETFCKGKGYTITIFSFPQFSFSFLPPCLPSYQTLCACWECFVPLSYLPACFLYFKWLLPKVQNSKKQIIYLLTLYQPWFSLCWLCITIVDGSADFHHFLLPSTYSFFFFFWCYRVCTC